MDDISQLLNSDPTGTTTSDIASQVTQILAWVIVPSVILTIIVIIFLVLYMLRKRKIENAIIEIRDILREMKSQQSAPAQESTRSTTTNNTSTPLPSAEAE